MKKIIGLPLLLAALLSPQLALAAQADCGDSVTTYDIIRCEGKQLDAAERALNAAYGRVMKELAGPASYEREAKALLVKAQRHWIAFREQDCAARSTAMGGGSLQGVVRVSCMREHAEIRTRQLDAFRQD